MIVRGFRMTGSLLAIIYIKVRLVGQFRTRTWRKPATSIWMGIFNATFAGLRKCVNFVERQEREHLAKSNALPHV